MSFRKRTPPSAPAAKLRAVDAALVAEVECLGFFRLVSQAEADAAKREILSRKYPLAGEVGRQFKADSENLAEYGVRNFVGYVAPFLRREGVRMEVDYRPWKAPVSLPGKPPDPEPHPYPGDTQRMRLSLERGGDLVAFEEEGDETGYRLVLGARLIVVPRGVDGNGWNEATTQTIALLSELLSAHGSPERAWSLYGGNDGYIVFASEALAAVLNSAMPERERLRAVAS